MYLTNFSGWIDGLYWIFIDKTPCFISHMFYKYILVCRQFQDHLCFNREWFLWKYLIFNTTAGSHSQRPPKMLWSYLGQTNFCEHPTIILLFLKHWKGKLNKIFTFKRSLIFSLQPYLTNKQKQGKCFHYRIGFSIIYRMKPKQPNSDNFILWPEFFPFQKWYTKNWRFSKHNGPVERSMKKLLHSWMQPWVCLVAEYFQIIEFVGGPFRRSLSFRCIGRWQYSQFVIMLSTINLVKHCPRCV